MLAATAEKSLSMLPPELAPDIQSVASVAHSAIASEAGQASRWTAARKVVSSSNFHSDAPLELKFSVINKVRVIVVMRLFIYNSHFDEGQSLHARTL